MGQYNPMLLSMFIILLLLLLKTFMFLVYSSWYVKVDFFFNILHISVCFKSKYPDHACHK